MDEERIEKTRRTAELYFRGVPAEDRPYDLARDLSLFITGSLYARERLPHPVRQLVTVGCLTVLGRLEELRLHIEAALNVGCRPEEIAEAIFQSMVYGGVPAGNQALKVLREVLIRRGLWEANG